MADMLANDYLQPEYEFIMETAIHTAKISHF